MMGGANISEGFCQRSSGVSVSLSNKSDAETIFKYVTNASVMKGGANISEGLCQRAMGVTVPLRSEEHTSEL